MVCVYDGRISNHPKAARIGAPAAARAVERQNERLTEKRLLEQQVAALQRHVERLRVKNATLRRQLGDLTKAARVRLERDWRHARQQQRYRDLLREMVAIVERQAGLEPGAMASDRRGRSHAWPRQVLCHLARTYCTRLSLPEIGAALNKDHTTVMHGVKAVTTRLAERCEATMALHAACLPAFKAAIASMVAADAADVAGAANAPGAAAASGEAAHGEG